VFGVWLGLGTQKIDGKRLKGIGSHGVDPGKAQDARCGEFKRLVMREVSTLGKGQESGCSASGVSSPVNPSAGVIRIRHGKGGEFGTVDHARADG